VFNSHFYHLLTTKITLILLLLTVKFQTRKTHVAPTAVYKMSLGSLASHFTYLISSFYAYLLVTRVHAELVQRSCRRDVFRGCLAYRVIGYPARCFVVFASISRRLPGYYTSLQRPLPYKSSSIHS